MQVANNCLRPIFSVFFHFFQDAPFPEYCSFLFVWRVRYSFRWLVFVKTSTGSILTSANLLLLLLLYLTYYSITITADDKGPQRTTDILYQFHLLC